MRINSTVELNECTKINFTLQTELDQISCTQYMILASIYDVQVWPQAYLHMFKLYASAFRMGGMNILYMLKL